MIHHAWGCDCPSRACARIRSRDLGYTRFLAVIFGGLWLAGIYLAIRAGLFSWLR